VSKGNKHLIINLFDHHEKNLGQMSMEEAKHVASERELKLVMIDENQSPPKFKLMKGSELAALQIKKRAEAKQQNQENLNDHNSKKGDDELSVKEIRMTLKSGEHDVKFKVKNMRNLYEHGHSIKLFINCRGSKLQAEQLEKLQKDFINNLKANPDMPNFVVNAIHPTEIIIHVNKK
jgi:translation initiation factor IF-3